MTRLDQTGGGRETTLGISCQPLRRDAGRNTRRPPALSGNGCLQTPA